MILRLTGNVTVSCNKQTSYLCKTLDERTPQPIDHSRAAGGLLVTLAMNLKVKMGDRGVGNFYA